MRMPMAFTISDESLGRLQETLFEASCQLRAAERGIGITEDVKLARARCEAALREIQRVRNPVVVQAGLDLERGDGRG